MRILILGAGAIGGYFGARLVEAGADVSFLVRPARATRLAERGLRVHSQRGGFAARVRTLMAADGTFDLVVLSCKAYDLDSAIAAIAPAVGPETRVLPLLNGLRQLDVLDAVFGTGCVLGGLAHVSVTLEADGAIRHFGTLERLTFGSRDRSPVPDEVAAALRSIGPQVVESQDILAAMWAKFVLIAALAGGTCLMRGAVGAILATTEGAAVLRRLHDECAGVAERSGYPSVAADREAAVAMLSTPRSRLKASMLRDIERGARTECEHILGDLRQRAIDLGIDTPLLAAALTHVRVHEEACLHATRGPAARSVQ